ncbi:NAD(P)-dependent oxidoreductase [Fulvimarina endophytica]|uniref:L-threonate dehydrogenase n=1 Tax=Fulvimarina endophytica TaxID=2293836 RepID=A0A371X5B3_9HYPH|nr:L-threonate dehydrogenase [Fulvimarina endophytica]RFC64410.1 NAD(P)-dependent oxidoreductase [Fulvimarina endophytica]
MREHQTMAVVGLGSMGEGMAKSLLRAGHTVYGVDLDTTRMATFLETGGAPGEALDKAAEIDVLVLVVLNDVQTEAVLFGPNGWADKLGKGKVIVSCATVPPEFAREMAKRCEEKGLLYLDAPISGGATKSAEGRLSVMASGSREAFKAARSMLDACAETVFELSEEPGQGSAMKAINQMLAGVHIAALAEAMTFGITQGVEPRQVMEVIPKCAGTSWMFENRGPHIVEGDYSPNSMVDIWPKDLGIVLDIAKRAKFGAPLTAAALQQFLAASGSGLGSEDDAAVAKVYARNAGIELPKGAS